MTRGDATMLERLATVMANELDRYAGEDGIELTHYDRLRNATRAILNELKQVDEGMVMAARKKYFVPNHANGLNGVIADIITSAIDQVLSQGEG